MVGVSTGAEHRQVPTTDPAWVEVHRVDAWAAGELAVSWAVTARPSTRRAGFLATVIEPGAPSIVLADHDIDLPAERWELRTSGLWADHICEAPLDHWSYGLESFALAVDDPAELLGRAVGDRTPLGWELEFEATAAADVEGPAGYRQDGVVHGLVLVGRRRLDVELHAVRRHWWGSAPPDGAFEHDPGPGAVALPEPGGCWWVELGPDGLQVAHQRR